MHETIRAVQNEHKASLFAKGNVVSVGIGLKIVNNQETDEVCITVGVINKIPLDQLTVRDIIPKTLGDCKTDVIEMGAIRALENTGRLRPAPGGISIGHKDITAGTLGCLVTKNDTTFILSNNHVLANSNNGEIGDAILQPGPADGGTGNTDRIGTLAEFVPIEFGSGDIPPIPPLPPLPPECGIAVFVEKLVNLFARAKGSSHRVQAYKMATPSAVNMVDAALAKVLDSKDVITKILEIGSPIGPALASLGDNIKKSGRTTGFTQGTVTQLHATVQVQYDAGRVATFEDQIISGIGSNGGDSGSVILNDNNEVIGLLFAGSPGFTIFNSIDHVLSALGVTILV